MDTRRRKNLDRLFSPASVAFLGGASALAAVRQCAGSGFGGDIWPVNPNRDEMAGYPCYASVAELPDSPDAAFLAVPGDRAIETVAELAAAGCGGIISYTAGFGELGDEGRIRERRLVDACGDTVLVGPNCSGILNYVKGVALWPFCHTGKPVEKGPAFITQSGMLGNTVTMNNRSLDFAYVISTGNQAMLGVEDFLDYLVDDGSVTAIALYIEGLRDIGRFADAAIRALDNDIPVVAQKVGTSDTGGRLTVTHTGALAGSDSLYQALFDRLGIIRVGSSTAMLETLKMVTIAGIPSGNRVAGFACSGGDSTVLADAADSQGIELSELSAEAAAEIAGLLPPIATLANPLDYTTPLWGHEEPLAKVFTAMAGDGYDAAIMVQDYPVPLDGASDAPYDADARAFARAVNEVGIPGAICSILPEDMSTRNRQAMIDGTVAPLQGIGDALGALGGAIRLGLRKGQIGDPASLRLLPPVAAQSEAQVLDEWEGKQVLKSVGVPVPDGRLVKASGVVSAAEAIGYPVVIKLVSPDLPHKTEAGAVRINLQDRQSVERALADISASVTARAPSVRIENFLVERMISAPVAELLVGIQQDAAFGPVMVIGTGGTLVELLHDTVTVLLPVGRDDIEAAVSGLRVSTLLDGYRGAAPADRKALVDAICALATFAVDNRAAVAELDVNPLVALEQGVVAADVLLRVSKPGLPGIIAG